MTLLHVILLATVKVAWGRNQTCQGLPKVEATWGTPHFYKAVPKSPLLGAPAESEGYAGGGNVYEACHS